MIGTFFRRLQPRSRNLQSLLNDDHRASRVLKSCSNRASPSSSSQAVSETAQYARFPALQNAR
jgi:hypothetical protein